jgi:hypothetical protein
MVRVPRSSWRVRATALVGAAVVALGASACTSSREYDDGPLNGVTADTVKIGYTIVDNGSLGQALGFKTPDDGGAAGLTAVVNALVAHVNAGGGMGGRQVEPVVLPYEAFLDSPERALAACNFQTLDNQVFAVVLDGAFQNNALPCYRAANTLVVDQTLIARDQKQFEDYSPYLWSATQPEYGAFHRAQLDALATQGFFAGSQGVLLMVSDDEVSRRVADTITQPFLQSQNLTNVRTEFIDSSGPGALGETTDRALVAGKATGADRVVVVGGARILPVAATTIEVEDFAARWAMSSYDQPFFFANNPDAIVTSIRDGMTGIGYSSPVDVAASAAPPFPDPANPAQVECKRIIDAAGATPPGDLRTNWRPAFQLCDATMFLDATLDDIGDGDSITAEQFKDSVAQIGDVYRTSIGFSSTWGEGVYAGTDGARPMSWHPECSCYLYDGDTIRFAPVAPAPASSAASPAASAPLPASPASPMASTPPAG